MTTLNPMLTEQQLTHGDLDEWSEAVALQRAAEAGVELTDEHWSVIYFLRDQCSYLEGMCNARKVIRSLQERFRAEGGKRYLYNLFPGGPVRQATYIAGLPMPPDTLDLSFGSVH